jgi:hypothetical protein
MTVDEHAREQRLRKQAELQSLYVNLANLRDREASYISASAAIPELLYNQINEQRHKLNRIEDELLALKDESLQTPGRQQYRQGFAAELAGNLEQALKHYKSVSRSAHPDAEAAQRSIRYRMRASKRALTSPPVWDAKAMAQSRHRLFWGAAILGLSALVVTLVIIGPGGESAAVLEATPTPTPPEVILIIPATATATATATAIPTATPTVTPLPAPVRRQTATPTMTPSPVPTLRPAPQILEPKDGLVWLDGAVVFEFKAVNMAYDELYCLTTMRGYDDTLTENWSFPPIGSKKPAIPVESNVFRVARVQGMKCVVWSGAIGKNSCDNIISEVTEQRMIGLPRPCQGLR